MLPTSECQQLIQPPARPGGSAAKEAIISMSTKNISFYAIQQRRSPRRSPNRCRPIHTRLISPDSPCWKFDCRFWPIMTDADRNIACLQQNDRRQHRPPRPLAKPAATATRLLKIQESVAAARRSALGENPGAQSSRASLTLVNDME
jgi:hypothetical protein